MPNFNVNMTPAEFKAGQKKAQADAIKLFFLLLLLGGFLCGFLYYGLYSMVNL